VRLLTRNGHDFADRFPLAVDAIAALPVRSCVKIKNPDAPAVRRLEEEDWNG
jgi:hypothetical protein